MPDNLENKYNWHKVYASAEEAAQQVPLRKLQQLELNGKQICFAHTQTGFFAVEDACPHLGYSLSRGTTNYLNEVICPWHSHRFNLENGRECKYRSRNAVTYPVEVQEDGVYIGIPK
ncbi:Rieske 2Fe-2S domain-containing protein [uncultured Pontibacter sp.]|uniref:Rieske (2Fe-2S) protein n=1 Tax=uncultured Pontibacter sp. TaxID=453356 RepID=UPI00261987BE|nr:Rieske 2Fe-2S domain-containing protein [uncultured Pontibacter sp.]